MIAAEQEALPDLRGSDGFAGAVNILYGSSERLVAEGSSFWHQDTPGVADTVGDNELFGQDPTAADLDGDGYDDLAIGVLEDLFDYTPEEIENADR